MEWYPHNIDAYDADTLHLTPAEDGIYSRLLRWYYKHERPLPNDEVSLAAIARVGIDEWRNYAPRITALFTVKEKKGGEGTELHKKKCNEVLVSQIKKRKDSVTRQRTLRNRNIYAPVTRDKRVNNAPRGEERRIEENNPPNSPPEGGLLRSEDFGKFWEVWPNKVGLEPAQRAWSKRVRANTLPTVEVLIEGAQNYVRTKPDDQKWIALARWISEGRWMDAPAPPKPAEPEPGVTVAPARSTEKPLSLVGWRLVAFKEIGKSAYESWIGGLQVRRNLGEVRVFASTRFQVDYLRTNYADHLLRWMRAEDASIARVVIDRVGSRPSETPSAINETHAEGAAA